MKVQKEYVTVRHCEYDGQLLSERVQHRNVYRPKTSAPYLKVLGGKRFLDSDNPPVVIYKPLSPPFDASFKAQVLDKIGKP